MGKPRYSEFADFIDIDAFEALIGFDVEYQRGDEDIGYCPDYWGLHKHGDTTGKFSINRDKRVYNCFVCGGGSFLSLLMEAEDLDVDTATEVLRKLTIGDQRSDDEFLAYYHELLGDVEKRTETLPFFNPRVLDKFDGPTDWFHSRGISDKTIEKYNLRFGLNVVKPAPYKGNEKIDDDYTGPAAIFPHYWKDRLVGWQHRWLEDEESRPKWVAKYTNTTDFPKTETIFNFDHALRSKDPVIVVESVPTVLFLESLGFSAVATFGSGANDPQLRLLRRFQQGVILAPDNDPPPKQNKKGPSEKMPPGIKWRNALTRYLERYITVQHAPVIGRADDPQGEDLGDLAKESDPLEAVCEVLAQAEEPGLNFLN